MPRYADLVEFLAVHGYRLETLGDHGQRVNLPRLELTLTLSPLAMPSSPARSAPISTYISGISSASQGRFRVMMPVCQCSVQRYVVAT